MISALGRGEKDNARPSKTEEVSLDDFSDGEIDLSAFMDNDSIDSSSNPRVRK